MILFCRDLFPASRCLFSYRGDVVAVARSMYRLTMVLPSLRLAYLLGHISADVTKMFVDSLGYDGSDFRVRADNGLTAGVLMAAVTTSSYLDLRRRGLDISAVRYEDIVARPLDMCQVILEFCHLPQSLAEFSVRAFDVDAQRNCVLARSAIAHFTAPELTPQIERKLNELLKKFDKMPLIGDAPGIVERTLTGSS